MSLAPQASPSPADPLTGGSSVHREPVVRFDGTVLGYTLTVTSEDTAHDEASTLARDAAVHERYLTLDLPNLVADRCAFLPATPEMLDGFVPAPATPGGLVLDLPAGFELEPDAARRAAALRGLGMTLSLSGYRGTLAQDQLLDQLAFVTLDESTVRVPDAAAPGRTLAELVAHAAAGGVVVLTDVTDALGSARARTAGVTAVRGGATVPEAGEARVLRAGQLQCLAALHLLQEPYADLGEVSEVIDTDPVLTLRVLHLVNSGAFALRHEVDTVHRAVVLLGPRELQALVAGLALDARPGAMDSLWLILARALTCEALSDDGAAYTVGMLSALVEQLGVPADVVLEKVGVSAVVADAVRAEEGPLGPVLAAVRAHERKDYAAVLAAGLAPVRVSDTYVDCLADALATARAANPG